MAHIFRKYLSRTLITSSVIAGLAAGSQPVIAQTVDNQPAPDGAPAVVESDAKEESIIVTGSRIERRNVDSSSPIQVIDSKELDARGYQTVAQALNELPSFGVPGASPVGFNQSGFGAGQSFVDFLGLGSQRTLTLVNGRRFVSSNTSSIFGPTGSGGSQVDLNTIPTKLIDRVETVAAIGAPIYGADAIAGTINILLKRDYDGIDLDAQYGLSSRGDAPDYRFRALVGKNFADGRGNITLSGEYNQSRGLLFTDRSLTSSDDRFDQPRTAGQFQQVPYRDFRIPSIWSGGIPLVGGAAIGFDLTTSPQQSNLFFGDPTFNFGVNGAGNSQLRFAPDGTLQAIDFGSTIGPDDGFNIFASGGNGFTLSNVQNLQTDLKRYNANAVLSYELSSDVRLFGEAWYSFSQGRNLASQPVYNTALFGPAGSRDGNLIIPLSNPFLTPSVRAAIQNSITNNPASDQNNPFGIPSLDGITQDYFYLGRANVDLSPGVSTGKVEVMRFVGGINGTLHVLPEKDWKFEASMNFGRSKTSSRNPEVNEQNFRNALNATVDGSGNIICAPGFINSPAATSSSTCAPLNLFGNQVSQAAKDYITTVATPRTVNEQYDAIVSVAGPLVSLPGGDLSFALGYEHRQESSSFDPGTFYFGSADPDPITDANGDGDPTNDRGSYGRSVPIDPVNGKYNTDEIFGELNADIVSPEMEVPLVRSLSFQSAARYVWNSLAGEDLTWTVGGRYSPFALLTLRGAYTRAIRAPSVTEAFNPTSSSFVFATDPCDRTQQGTGPDPATRAKNCAAAGIPTNFQSLSNSRSFPGFTFGNPDLSNEKSDSYSAGIVITPVFLRGLSATVDYVDITLKNAISQFGTSQVVAACYDSTTFPDNPFCALVTRDATNQLSNVGTTYFNSAKLRYKGILADIRYSFATPVLGATSRLGLSASYQYLDTLTNQVGTFDRPNITDNSVGYSKHKGVVSLSYDNEGFSTQVQASYIGKAKVDPNAAADFYSISDVNSVIFVNLAMSYDVGDRFTIRANVDNLFGTTPPYPYPLAGGTTTYFRGILGPYFRIGAAVHF